MECESAESAKFLTLDDIEVGQIFRSSLHKLDESQITTFAGQFDPQPFHLNHQAAESTLFGGLAASGWHTAAITMRLIVESTPLADGIIGAGAEVSWPRPTRPGDTLHVESEVMEITPSRSRPDRGMVTVRSTTFNQNDEPVQILVSKLVVSRRATV